jgi:16S rRNA (guanine966-N2)-methyltransferase
MTLRIAGGQFRGRNLKTPESSATRPTTEMVRQAVFNICQEWVPNARFLDVFAGSGAMGFEAISRGASFATFAENDPEASKCIIENSEKLAIQKQVQILISDARLSLAKLSTPYDLIYIDPPYDKDATDLLQLIVEKKLLVSNGLLFYEERFDSKKIPTCLGLDLIQSKKYGITHLHQYRLSTI